MRERTSGQGGDGPVEVSPLQCYDFRLTVRIHSGALSSEWRVTLAHRSLAVRHNRRELAMGLTMRWIVALALLPAAASAVAVGNESSLDLSRAAKSRGAPVPYVIITDRDLQRPFMQLAQARSTGGLAAAVITLQKIEEGYPTGVDLAERVRLFLRDAHANWGTQFVLLGGDENVVPMRHAFIPQGPSLGDILLATDQYYACLDGSWNADGDGLWGENPRGVEPGDDVDCFPELFVGRAPVGNAAEAAAFVHRTLAYERRLATATPRSVLLAAEILGSSNDHAYATEALRPGFESDPSRSILRLYENSAAWPGSLPESRTALLRALDDGVDLVVLLGGGLQGFISAGVDPVDLVTSEDFFGLMNAPPSSENAARYPIVYVISCGTTGPGDPLSNGHALLRAPQGGAVAVLGSSNLQFLQVAYDLMEQFFDRAVGATSVPIGKALAGAIAATSSAVTQNGIRLTTQGTVLFGDPALHVDPPSAGNAVPGMVRLRRARGGLTDQSITRHQRESSPVEIPVATGPHRKGGAEASIEAPSIARGVTTLRFELPIEGTGTYAIDVFDASGRKVRALANGAAGRGLFQLDWDLRSDAGALLPSGIYFVRLNVAATSLTHRIVVLR